MLFAILSYPGATERFGQMVIKSIIVMKTVVMVLFLELERKNAYSQKKMDLYVYTIKQSLGLAI